MFIQLSKNTLWHRKFKKTTTKSIITRFNCLQSRTMSHCVGSHRPGWNFKNVMYFFYHLFFTSSYQITFGNWRVWNMKYCFSPRSWTQYCFQEHSHTLSVFFPPFWPLAHSCHCKFPLFFQKGRRRWSDFPGHCPIFFRIDLERMQPRCVARSWDLQTTRSSELHGQNGEELDHEKTQRFLYEKENGCVLI